MFRRLRYHLAAATFVLLVVAGLTAWLVHRHHKYKHFAVHEPGMVYRSAWLDAEVFAELIEEHQIRTIVNLCDEGELTPEHWSSQRQAVHARCPLIVVTCEAADSPRSLEIV